VSNSLKDSLLLVARVTSVFGVKGWVNVFSYTDPPENVLSYKTWLLCPSEGNGQDVRDYIPNRSECRQVKLTEGRRHGKRIIVQLDGNNHREQAGEFVQHDVFIQRSELPELDDDVYWIELEGLEVINLQGHRVGKIIKIFETGANDVMVVAAEGDQEEEVLIPYVEDHYVIEVDLKQKCITVDWPID